MAFKSAIKLLAALGLGLAGLSAAGADTKPVPPLETAALPPTSIIADQAVQQLPGVLSDADAALYAEIFRVQEGGNWRKADKLIKQLGNDVLMGHVQFQRYMHPTHYRSKYLELKEWMGRYADHPGAKRVYDLALKRRPKNYKYPKRPRGVDLAGMTVEEPQKRKRGPRLKKPYRSKAQRSKIRRMQYQIKRLVQRGSVTISWDKLKEKPVRKLFDRVSYSESLGIVARGYFRYHKDAEAIEVARQAIKASPEASIDARWWGGLAAWRSADYGTAARFFEDLSQVAYAPADTRAAAAYWASRAYLVGGQPARVNPMLDRAAQHDRTFYGLLAGRALGLAHGFDWALPQLSDIDAELLMRVPAARRSLALIEAGQAVRAETELKRFIGALPASLTNAVIAFADKAGLADVAYRVGASLERHQGLRYDAALYPLPGWAPEGGYSIDRAMIFAFVRQESRFRPKAKSRVGARGLMQLMPATAGFMAGKRFRGRNRDKLFDPTYNLTLGQKYLQHLLEDPVNGGNLFYLTAAYNGGPGNLQKWRRKVDYQNDPLLFIESLPSRETRLFVEHVLSNLWIYRYRMQQEVPSLDAILAGNWPIYYGLDDRSRVAAGPAVSETGNQ